MQITTELTELSNELTKLGFTTLAKEVSGASSTFIKVAKELGGQGYWVQNSRCWQGCYRKKRASFPNKTAQDVWFDCQKEYETAISGDPTDWNQYAIAGGSANAEYLSSKTAEINKFNNLVKTLVASGNDIGTAVYSTISDEISNLQLQAISAAEQITRVSDNLSENNILLSTKAAELASSMIKEAWGWNGVSNVFAPLTNKVRGLGPNSNKVDLGNIEVLLTQLNNTLNGFIKQKQSFESALTNSRNIPTGLRQILYKGLRPLSQTSMKTMLDEVEKYRSKPKILQDNTNQIVPHNNKNTFEIQNGIKPEIEPSDEHIHQEQYGNPQPSTVEQTNNSQTQSNPATFIQSLEKYPSELLNEIAQKLTGKKAKYQLFNIKTAALPAGAKKNLINKALQPITPIPNAHVVSNGIEPQSTLQPQNPAQSVVTPATPRQAKPHRPARKRINTPVSPSLTSTTPSSSIAVPSPVPINTPTSYKEIATLFQNASPEQQQQIMREFIPRFEQYLKTRFMPIASKKNIFKLSI